MRRATCLPVPAARRAGIDGVVFDGDSNTLQTIVSRTDQPGPAFAIVTPGNHHQ